MVGEGEIMAKCSSGSVRVRGRRVALFGRGDEQEEILQGMGRVRDVATGPDGSVYVVLNDPNKIIRLIPATK